MPLLRPGLAAVRPVVVPASNQPAAKRDKIGYQGVEVGSQLSHRNLAAEHAPAGRQPSSSATGARDGKPLTGWNRCRRQSSRWCWPDNRSTSTVDGQRGQRGLGAAALPTKEPAVARYRKEGLLVARLNWRATPGRFLSDTSIDFLSYELLEAGTDVRGG